MLYPDLSAYAYNLKRPLNEVLCVGWLEAESSFTKGQLESSFTQKLLTLIEREPVNVMLGIHECSFCRNEEVRVLFDDRSLLLGCAEVWVPEPGSGIVYAAPDLIYHYCAMHAYLPPAAFVRAVEAFDPNSGWSGNEILDTRFK